MSTPFDDAHAKIKHWSQNGVDFVRDNFGVEPDLWQKRVLIAFTDPKQPKLRISMQACVGPGKTAVLAWCILLFLSCYGEAGNHPKGAAVSITSDNLKDNLWPEISKWMSKSKFLSHAFKWTKERVFAVDHPETWFISARSFSKKSNADEQGRTLSGLHSGYVLAVIDESGEVPPAVAKAAEQAFSEVNCKFARILQAGNPSSLEGILYQACNELAHLWHVIRVTGDPDDPERSPRIDIEWAKEQIRTWGRNNPWVMYSILGKFPPNSINTLIGPDEVRDAMNRHLQEDAYIWSQKRLGVDVARFGDDTTIIFPRQGLAAFNFIEMKGARTPAIAARVIRAKLKWGSEREYVDGTGGFGAGVIDNMMTAGYDPMEVQFSGEPDDKQFYNKRAEMYFEAIAWIRRGGSLPDDPQLLREICAPTYTLKDGKFLLEPKELIKKRLGFSPDKADAFVLTFAEPDMGATIRMPDGRPVLGANRHQSEWNPYQEKPDENHVHRSDWNPYERE